jgi:hypothetical protein
MRRITDRSGLKTAKVRVFVTNAPGNWTRIVEASA